MVNRKQKKKEKIKYYFAYGSNMNHEHMKMRCPKSKYLGTFELPGYKLVFRSVADVEQSNDDSVLGALFEITDECVRALDRAKEMPGFQQLTKTHRERDFSILESEINDFVSLVDDYMRGDEPK